MSISILRKLRNDFPDRASGAIDSSILSYPIAFSSMSRYITDVLQPRSQDLPGNAGVTKPIYLD
ncbi:MAG: hypothetical protein GDA48_04450 [Hormoscilla sp. GM102CHS1]|nr:hypothetical protein [Hormoscilla sp. GM102CHS1]